MSWRHGQAAFVVWAHLALFAVGCGDESEPGLVCEGVEPGGARELVSHDLWRVATAAEDPWREFRPAEDISCPARARQPEDFAGILAYSILTAQCGYTTVVQETLAPACRGETFYVWIWNNALTAPENTQAHLGVEVGGVRLWEKVYDIPGPPGLVTDRIVLDHDLPAGTTLYYHVRNHGQNSYELLQLSIVHPDPDAAPIP